MGACGSTESGEAQEQKKHSQMIDRKLEEDSRRLRRECKILLLGSGESGKSTIVKQMKIIHQNGYSKDELSLYRLTIYKNLIDCAKSLIAAIRQFEIEVQDPTVREYMDYIADYTIDPDPSTELEANVADAITGIWNDAAVPKVMEHQSEFYLMDSAP
ncbi:MAG: hypothetical protein Q9227_006992 [Pyrenula ochraceoflavens]